MLYKVSVYKASIHRTSIYRVFNVEHCVEYYVEYYTEYYIERHAKPLYIELLYIKPLYTEPAFIHRAFGFRVVSRLVYIARHKIVVKWGDISMGQYFDEANFRRWRFSKYGLP